MVSLGVGQEADQLGQRLLESDDRQEECVAKLYGAV